MDALLNAIGQYISFSTEEGKLIAGLFTEKRLESGEFFLREGHVCRHLAFVASGLVRCVLNHDGLDKTIFFSKEGDFVTNYQSFLQQIPSTKSIEALEDTVLYVITRDDLERFYKEVREGERFGRMALEWVFISMMQQMDSLYAETAELRYKRFLETYASISQRIPQFYIASYVGVRAPSLSRIRRRFINPG